MSLVVTKIPMTLDTEYDMMGCLSRYSLTDTLFQYNLSVDKKIQYTFFNTNKIQLFTLLSQNTVHLT